MTYTKASKNYYERNKETLNNKAKEKYHKNAKQICRERRLRPTVRFGRCKRMAERRNIDFCLTLEGFTKIWSEREENCPILEIPLTHPSIDRIINNAGYTLDNVQCISSRANNLKKDGTAKEHLQIAVHAYGVSEQELRTMFENEIKRLKT